MNVLVTGSRGYIGSVLVPKLGAAGHRTIGVDSCWFEDVAAPEWDLRRITQARTGLAIVDRLQDADAVIHLAAVANDPAGEAFTKLTWEVNALATMRLAEAAVRAGVKHFIYASSGSVYGVRPEAHVTEETPLTPISDYNKTKMVAERCLLSYADRMAVTIVRPGTVCGYSPRTRLDVAVNALTIQALTKGVMTVHGGDQIRPYLHVEDMADLYCWLLEPSNRGLPVIATLNAAYENLSLRDTAERIAQVIPAEIRYEPSADSRSYRLDASRLATWGFVPRRSITDAVRDLQDAFHSGALRDEPWCYNLQWMKARGIS